MQMWHEVMTEILTVNCNKLSHSSFFKKLFVTLPTSIQSGGWILHFLLCFKNIATHIGTSVGKDALNGPMSPCEQNKNGCVNGLPKTASFVIKVYNLLDYCKQQNSEHLFDFMDN